MLSISKERSDSVQPGRVAPQPGTQRASALALARVGGGLGEHSGLG
jgi:hypothetical protein